MRVSRSVFVATLCSTVFAAPQIVTVTTTVYPQSAATPAVPKAATTVPWTTVPASSTTKQSPPIPTLSLSPQLQPEIIPPNPGPRASSSSTRPSPKLSPPPRPAPRPQAPPSGPASLCGTGKPACAAGQYCYDANLDRVVGTAETNAFGTCYGSACSASVSCPVGQVSTVIQN
jgi:hypothetical protein